MDCTSFHLYILRKIIWICKNTLFYVYKISNVTKNYELVHFDHLVVVLKMIDSEEYSC